MPRSHKSEIQPTRAVTKTPNDKGCPNDINAGYLVVCTSQDLCYKPSTLCLPSLPLRRKHRRQNCDIRHWHATTAHGPAAERNWDDDWCGSEEQTVAWLEVSVDDFDWSFCMEVMHSCKVIKHQRLAETQIVWCVFRLLWAQFGHFTDFWFNLSLNLKPT